MAKGIKSIMKRKNPYKNYKTEITKVKGLKSSIAYSELKTILNKETSLTFMQEK
jgi:hypothetical protein